MIAEKSASAKPAKKKKPGRPAKKKATSTPKGSTKKRGRRPGGNLDKIKKAVGKRGSRIKDIAKKTGIAAPNVSNYISNNPSVFVKSRKRGVEVILKYDNNFQERTSIQPDNRIADLSVVAKADYEWRPWRQLRVIPQVKWLRQRLKDDEQRVTPIHERFFYPILRLEYPLSPRTTVKFGAQGFPFLKSTYRSEVSPGVDFDAVDYLALVSNTSAYVGYQVNVNLGYERRRRTFVDEQRSDQNIDYSRFFLRVIAGLRPLF